MFRFRQHLTHLTDDTYPLPSGGHVVVAGGLPTEIATADCPPDGLERNNSQWTAVREASELTGWMLHHNMWRLDADKCVAPVDYRVWYSPEPYRPDHPLFHGVV